jgi:hypothetical protein
LCFRKDFLAINLFACKFAIMASRSPKRGQAKSQGPAEEKLEDKHESNLNEEDRHKLSGDIDCIIVGAGLSGLKAARDLAVRGFKVCVFESSHRVGGRCYSTVFPETTTYVDLGGEWFDVNRHTLTMEETERYNLKVLHQEGVESGKFAYSFSYPGRKIITRAEIPEDYMEEYTRISGIINNHLALFSFSKGYVLPALLQSSPPLPAAQAGMNSRIFPFSSLPFSPTLFV